MRTLFSNTLHERVLGACQKCSESCSPKNGLAEPMATMTADESDTVEMEDLPGESDRIEMVFCLCNVSMISVCVSMHMSLSMNMNMSLSISSHVIEHVMYMNMSLSMNMHEHEHVMNMNMNIYIYNIFIYTIYIYIYICVCIQIHLFIQTLPRIPPGLVMGYVLHMICQGIKFLLGPTASSHDMSCFMLLFHVSCACA